MENVNKNTRSPYDGKSIICPHCKQNNTVYHFSWSSMTCTHCEADVDKYDFLLEEV